MKEKIIKIFNQVRDIPYRIPLTLQETDYCCSGKSVILKSKLEKIGLKVRFAVGCFYWSSFILPDLVVDISHDKDCTHTWIEVYLNNVWVKLDSSWDRALNTVFPIAQFDGKHDTILAVKIEDYFSQEKSEKIMNNQEKSESEELIQDLEKNAKFYEAFNNYLEETRNKV
jgi:hypothetical protein